MDEEEVEEVVEVDLVVVWRVEELEVLLDEEVDLVMVWRVEELEVLLDEEDERVEGAESRGAQLAPRSPVLLKESDA